MGSAKMILALFHVFLLLTDLTLSQSVEDISTEKADGNNQAPPSVTQTVYGFLDFTTTIGNTVMVFSPQSAATTSSEKPTSPIAIINEKPSESAEAVVEIRPSKPEPQATPSELLNSDIVTPSSPNVDKKPSTKSTFKGSSHPSTNVTHAKPKSLKPIIKSSPLPTTPAKAVLKDKPKALSKPPVTQKAEASTEASAHAQPAPTKKIVDKKTTPPGLSTPSKPVAAKPKIEKGKPLVHPHGNITTKAKFIPKTEKPKSTEKLTTKPASTISTSATSASTEDNADIEGSVSVASKMEVNEGPITVQKVKKSDIEAANAVNTVTPSTVEAKSETEEQKSSTEDAKSSAAVTPKKDEHSETSSADQDVGTSSATTPEEPAIISSSAVQAPEYDYLSRQPSEVIDETFRVIDLKPNGNKYHKQKASQRVTTPDTFEETQPLGLITSLSDSIVRDGLTTVYETNVIGTTVNGKYAQVLQSSSHVQQGPKKIKPTAATSVRILKTVAPTSPKTPPRQPNLEPTPAYEDDSSSLPSGPGVADGYGEQPKASRKATFGSSGSGSSSYAKNKYASNKNKFKDDYREDYGTTSAEEEEALDTDYTSPNANPTPSSYQQPTTSKKASTKKSNQSSRPYKHQNNRFGRPTTPELATVSVFSEAVSSVTPSYGSGNRRFQPSNRRFAKPTTSTESDKGYVSPKRSYKSKIGPSHVDSNNLSPAVSSSTYKFKLSRPSGRWQYKTSPKPRVTIRRQDESLDNVTVSPVPQFTPDVQLEGSDQELSGSGLFPALQHEDNSIVHEVTPSLTVETLRVEISTPADFKDVYYEIATIKSPYTFQVGTVKNTRFITVTSTFEKSLVQPTEATSIRTEPLSENILASTHNAYDKEPPLDSSIATLPPIGLAGDAETPPLETMTESFSTTQLMLKTHILPVVRGGSDTVRYTLVQSYHVTRLVTATKTLPPMEVYQFVPSKTLNEFNTRLDEAGSEVHLELDFGDNNDQDDEGRPNVAKALLSDLDLTHVGSDFDISEVDKNKLLEQHLRSKKAHKTTTTPPTTETPTTPALTAEQLQQLALLRLLNPNAALPNLITSSKPIIKIETAYETHILPVFNGASTYFTTIARPTATLTKTEYELVTSTLPTGLQPSIYNPLFPPQPIQLASTPLITQTMLTQTDSKVLKLTFGAKTTYTTLYTTKVTPTILTTYLTNSIAIQPTAATFPGFFNPAPYAFNGAFPFVG